MAVSRYTSRATICSLLVTGLLLFPMPSGGVSANGFPENVAQTRTDPSSLNTSCYTHVNVTYNTSSTVMVRGKEITRTVKSTRTVRTCCTGYSGDHCNITNTTTPSENHQQQQQQQHPAATADDPCGNLTCSNYPDAVCAVVTKCGEKIPIFLNSEGVAVDCGNHRPVEELRKTSCGNVCPFDPCLGKTCSRFPNAVCLTTPCDCKPLWLLETGVRVDCSTGEQLLPQRTRSRRQTNSPTQTPTCIS